MKRLPLFLLGLLVINAVFAFCAFGVEMNSHCPLGLSMASGCLGENIIQSAAHHISTMLNSTLAVLPILIGFVALAAFAIFILETTILRPWYNLSETKVPSFIPQRRIFKWLSITRQRDPEDLIWMHSIG
jgi:hypothetical protein